jgi:hypothetical protein
MNRQQRFVANRRDEHGNDPEPESTATAAAQTDDAVTDAAESESAADSGSSVSFSELQEFVRLGA